MNPNGSNNLLNEVEGNNWQLRCNIIIDKCSIFEIKSFINSYKVFEKHKNPYFCQSIGI